MASSSPYPVSNLERDQWILERRPAREALDPRRPYAFFVEEEATATGGVVPVATVFLTNRECPWRCVMCDLWRNTLTEPAGPGAIPAQIDYALLRLSTPRVLKLYNNGSFFDRQAIPVEDHSAIAERANRYERLIVENHPALVGEDCLLFRDRLSCRLEVAMGLETVHPEILPRLNKRMTLEQFSRAASFLRENDIDLRVFILVKPPFMRAEETVCWASRSLDFAFDCGATAATLIRTRGGNGAMEALSQAGKFAPPSVEMLEEAVDYGLSSKRGRVFADLWDVQRISGCSVCFPARVARLREINLKQEMMPIVHCNHCNQPN